MEIFTWYQDHFERSLLGRYVTSEHIEPVLKRYENIFDISVAGHSIENKKIYSVTIGKGNTKVFGWSQMHGNESTTTKAIFDFLKFVAQKEVFQQEIAAFLDRYTVCLVPILNPDGAFNYIRENSKGIDLNRDALEKTQIESRVLAGLFDEIQPDLCLNLHGQRTIYGLPNKKSATISFLSPAANEARDITVARKGAMEHIVRMEQALQPLLPGQIGRYDDSFNPNCVGDRFQTLGVPSVLFEAGHYPGDYQREKTREYIWYALLVLFNLVDSTSKVSIEDYFKIPENETICKDVIIRNAKINGDSKPTDIAIQYEEVLDMQKGTVQFVPVIDAIDNLEGFFGHKEVDAEKSEILLNSYENVFVGAKVASIVDKYSVNRIFF